MKRLILIFLVCFGVTAKAQTTSIPDTDTGWSLQDVHDVLADWGSLLGDPVAPKLDSCFISAEYFTSILGSLFDSRYEGSHNSLLNFRNYAGTGAFTTPTVITTEVSAITYDSAESGGEVTSDGGLSVSARGVCWSTSVNPTLANSHTHNGTGTGVYTSSITGLIPSTLYYFRAYATNAIGTSYGAEDSFTTSAACRPSGYIWGLYHTVNNIPVTVDNVCDFTPPIYGQAYTGTSTDPMNAANGADIYFGVGYDCTKMPDGYYVNGVPSMRYYRVLDGKIYEICL
jgi:hypothetical protein